MTPSIPPVAYVLSGWFISQPIKQLRLVWRVVMKDVIFLMIRLVEYVF